MSSYLVLIIIRGYDKILQSKTESDAGGDGQAMH